MSRKFPDRRNFLKQASAFAGVATVAAALPFAVSDASALDSWFQSQGKLSFADSRPDDIIASDEQYWLRVRSLYDLQPGVSNLDHGWTNPTPRAALNELIKRAKALEALPAEQLPHQWETVSNTRMRAALATAMKVAPTELALVRNATEALNTVLLGFPLSRGDEVVCSSHDYYATLDALEQRRARDGIVLKMVKPPVPAPSMSALESMYAEAIGDRTKLVLLTHPSNFTGQYLPVRRIADRAHLAGAEVVVDGAQSLGLLED
ncbi:MAG: aminotransferase class V-fold PLP-dependent enzyme, partial [Gemmatimonadaceae bacterium]